MASVDDRVVNMVFNNSAFEQKIAGTMGSLEKLNKSLAFPNAGKGLADVSSAASGFHLNGMSAAIEGVSGKFLALSTIAVTALATVVSHAVTAGVNLAKSLSLDQVIGGFKEYETNMNSIQTIMANTSADATTLDEVNAALQKLNIYSDQTIYNFGQMARNIGTFTAAGVDLDTSVNSIKGIANLAALSGSNAEQASTAMYQLSQAMASGTVKLMDWNSVVNAGMGGEIFQKALFETGKSLGTIADVPIDQTFEEWTDAGNTFRGSLEDGWITADVLTNTLQGFTGDLTEAQLMALGYTQSQAVEMMRLGAVGKAAATEVKTLTQLIGTVKESVGSGWSQSFGIIIGDFDEAKALFTDINSSIGAFVGANADARNALLQGWKDMGGRQDIIEGAKNAFEALGKIITPIKEAFQEFFPPMTAARLKNLTSDFQSFTEKLIPGKIFILQIKRLFEGLFAAIEIGWTIIKEFAGVIGDLFGAMSDAVGDNKVMSFFINIANKIIDLNELLVGGGGIEKFFGNLASVFSNPMYWIDLLTEKVKAFFLGTNVKDGISPAFELLKDKVDEVKDKLIDLFNGTEFGGALTNRIDEVKDKVNDFFGLDALPDGAFKPLERLTDRWSGLKDLLSSVVTPPEWLTSLLTKTGEVLDDVWEGIKTWCSELGAKLAAAMKPGDFDAALDVLNVAFLGGIVAFLAKLTSGGIKFDIGDGFMKNISKSFDTLTGTLKVMQTEIKADILIKIAAAIGLLSVAVLILSLIDSEDLTKAMAAMAVGFTQLLGVMKLMDTIAAGPMGAAKLGLMAGAMILMAGAMVILGTAMLIFASMSWEELAKGFAGVGVGLGLIAAGMQLMPDGIQMVLQSAALVLIGTALTILAGAVALFALMDWTTLAKGFAAIGVGLGIIAAAMHLMPGGIQMVLQSAALNLVATSLTLLAGAVALFALMSWEDLGKGAAAVGGGLAIIAGAMHLMPGGVQMVLQAAGLVLVGIALNAIATAMLIFGTMSWTEIGKGLTAMAGALVILAVATNGMASAIIGAVAITLVSIALGLLVTVMKEIAKMSWAEIGKALLGIVAIMAAIGIAALALQSAIGPMLLLGAAMLILGAGFALFGLGAKLVVEAFMLIANGGGGAVAVIIKFIKELIKQVPGIVKAFAVGLIDLAMTILKAAPVLIKALGVVIQHLLETIIELAPQLFETITVLITGMLQVIRDLIPEFVKTGFALLVGLLTGIRDNIFEITTLAVEIILGFIDALKLQLPFIVTAAVELLAAFLQGIADNIGLVVASAVSIVTALLDGIAANVTLIVEAATGIITSFVEAISSGYLLLIAAGVKLIVDFLKGISDSVDEIVTAAVEVVASFITAIANSIGDIIAAGTKLVIDFITGIGNAAIDVSNAAGDMIIEFFKGLTAKTVDIIQSGKDLIITFITGIGNAAEEIATAAVDTVIAFMVAIQSNANRMFDAAFDILIAFINGLTVTIAIKGKELRDAGWKLAIAIADGFTFGMASKAGGMIDALLGPIDEGLAAAKHKLESDSPSKVFYRLGEGVATGFANGINDDDSVYRSVRGFSERTIRTFQETLSKLPSIMDGVSEFVPTITPVLDLTQVMGEARKLSDILGPGPALSLALSATQARAISVSTTSPRDESTAETAKGPTEIKFEQNNYSPEALSTADIYRQTRNQIALAKEALAVP